MNKRFYARLAFLIPGVPVTALATAVHVLEGGPYSIAWYIDAITSPSGNIPADLLALMLGTVCVITGLAIRPTPQKPQTAE